MLKVTLDQVKDIKVQLKTITSKWNKKPPLVQKFKISCFTVPQILLSDCHRLRSDIVDVHTYVLFLVGCIALICGNKNNNITSQENKIESKKCHMVGVMCWRQLISYHWRLKRSPDGERQRKQH